jgi:hypothetical protein
MKFCMECGTELPERAKFCFNCGLQLTDQPAASWDDEPAVSQPVDTALPIASPMPEPAYQAERPRTYEPPVPVASHAFREPYVPPEPAVPLEETAAFTSLLPWDTEERDDLVPPPASAYADDLLAEDVVPPPASPYTDLPLAEDDPYIAPPPPPPPRYESYVVDEPAPPFADGYDVPNIPPDPLTLTPTPAGPQKQQNWFVRHKLVTATAIVLGAVIIAAAVNSNNDDPPATSPATSIGDAASSIPGLVPAPTFLPAATPPGADTAPLSSGRPNARPTDQERPLGAAASIDGLDATVMSAGFQQSVAADQTEGYVVADVSYANRSGQTKPYNSLDWKLQTPAGTTADIEFAGSDGQLSSGELAADGTVAGKITFKVGAEKGDFYILWTPEGLGAERGVWKVTIT